MLKSISYSAAIDILRTDVQVGLEVTHSLWAGGATDAANIGVCDFIYEEKPWSLEIGFCEWGFSRRKCT